ncbi:MAG: GAF domain-containing protein [Myxococcales bacterium]|nr:GAF domain-containing protein [Myxococcales bacterium]
MSPAEKLAEEAAAVWLEGEVVSTGAPTERAAEDSGVRERASGGHSPSARALVNASDTVARLSAAAAVPPPQTLRSRVLAGVSRVVSQAGSSQAGAPQAGASGGEPGAGSVAAPSELVGRLHAADPREVVRRQRIEGLRASGGPGEERTDEALTVLLDQIAPYFGHEIVLVSAVIGDKTIHRVHRGFPPTLGNMDVVPRELSFCTHTVSAGEPFFVENTLAEAFFRSSVLVQQLGARAYLGVPLFSEDVALGSLCVISGAPQRVSGLDVTILSGFAKVAQALVLHDERALSALLASRVEGEPWVYAAPFLDELLTAQAARAKSDPAAHATRHVRLSGAARDAAPKLPPSLVVGEDGDARVVLVPSRHPDAAAVVDELAGRGAAVRSL